MTFGIASVAGITVIATLAGAAWKTADKLDDKWIPVICGSLGLILGIVGYCIGIKDFPADDIITAAAVGIVSGFAATGINQVFKQFKKDDSDSSDKKDKSTDIEDDPREPVEDDEVHE